VSTKLEYDDDDESVRVAKDLKDSPYSLERENEMMMDAILSDSLIRNTELQRSFGTFCFSTSPVQTPRDKTLEMKSRLTQYSASL
jgi:hypothetical protein